MDKITSVALAIVVVGGITAVVLRPNSATVINSIGNAFTNSLRVAISGR